MEEQSERESQKLWHGVTEAIKRKDQDAATDEKTRIEEMQRAETAKRHSEGIDWQPQLFRSTHGGQGGLGEGEEDLDWIMNAKMSVVIIAGLYLLLTLVQRREDARGAGQTDSPDRSYTSWPNTRQTIQHTDPQQQYSSRTRTGS
jgi:hypothetical protein